MFGSEGERRAACLGLRLASVEMIKDRTGSDKPVVLLVDDVLGELDERRRTAFLDMTLHADQVFFAATELPHHLKGRVAAVHTVTAGTLSTDAA